MTGITTKDHIKVLLVGLINTERPKKERNNKRPHEFYFKTQFFTIHSKLYIPSTLNTNYLLDNF